MFFYIFLTKKVLKEITFLTKKALKEITFNGSTSGKILNYFNNIIHHLNTIIHLLYLLFLGLWPFSSSKIFVNLLV
jgi:hypothetical protein